MMHCVQCSTELIAPECSQYWSNKRVCNIWHCPRCSACFGSPILFPNDAALMKDNKTGRMIFPSLFPALLVA
jgi:hypothetical protein